MKPRPRHARRPRSLYAALAFISPWLVGLAAFTLYPIVASFYHSFCDYSVLQPAQFIGGANYADLVTDEVFWKTLRNTAFYAAFALPLGLVVSLGLALLLNTGVRGMTLYRTFFFLPSLVPFVALAVLWLWIFNGENGVLNYFLSLFGIHGPGWLADPRWTKPALVIAGTWGVGQAIVIYLAGLQDVPVHLYEAADLDGAGWWDKIRHVTLPMISPVILFNLVMGIIGTLQYFTVPYVMTPQGQPARSAYFYIMYLYDNAFVYLKMGYASAMAWILFLIIIFLTALALRLTARHVHYEGE
ncbi:MAG: sugar ABC transporter permease [Armatimonadota bacterium]|nr:MAG: sugar ABC transporter permease [Armatimonadota bacterium]